eukprot:15237579-Ditylum_brightwellii.AAC.1
MASLLAAAWKQHHTPPEGGEGPRGGLEEAPGHGGWSGYGAPPAMEGGLREEGAGGDGGKRKTLTRRTLAKGTRQDCTGTRDGRAHGQRGG